MAIKGQNSCTLSTITDVKSIYTYHLLVPSTTVVTNNMAPKDATTDNPGNPPGASSITITYLSDDYIWTISEPGINIQTNDVGTLYYIECTLFSDNTFDWGPIMTSSSYEAAKQAYNRAKTALDLASDINQYFWTLSSAYSQTVPAGVYVTGIPQNQFKLNPSQGNILIQNTGLTIRDGLNPLASLTGDALNFYNPSTHNTSIQLNSQALNFYNPNNDNLTLSLNNSGLNFYGSSTSEPDASLTSTGLTLTKGGIQAGIPNEGQFIYLSTEDYPLRQYVHTSDSSINPNKTYYIYDDDNNIYVQVINPDVAELENYYELSVEGININGHIPTENTGDDTPWRMVIGNQFGVDANGTLYALGANISGQLNITGGNVYTKEETDLTTENIYNTIDNIENQTIYAYSNNSDGSDYSYTNNILKYRGILVTNSQTDEEIIIPSEKVYEKTTDSQIDETKIYYRLINNEFIAVETSDQSQINNYYEFIEEHYEKTLDLQIDETKTYYELINNEFVVVEEPDQSEINNYYEFIAAYYVKTSDMLIDETKTYYELVNNKFIIVNNPIQSEINDYYELSIDEQPNKFNWEINPIYAEQNASNYMVNINGGVRIGTSNSNAYLTLNASLMQFWLNKKSMAHFGYDNMYESYGITVENVMITGAGNALRLDNGLNGTYQGQFILETRSNGHLSLKPGLRRNEEEEEI